MSQVTFVALAVGARRSVTGQNDAVKAESANQMIKADGDWFLREWMKAKGKKQADIIRELGWERGQTSKVFNGKIPYKRETVLELSAWLEIEPYELLMPPAQAQMLRRLRTAAIAIAELT